MRRLIIYAGLAMIFVLVIAVGLSWQAALLCALFFAFAGLFVAVVERAESLLGRRSWYANKRLQGDA
jgi:uncharacterized membrane protein